MKVLLINNFFTNAGGSEKSTFQTGQLLEQKGHQVYYYASNKQPYTINDYKYSQYFPEYIEYSKLPIKDGLRKFPKSFYNHEAKNNLTEYLQEIKPDIAHLNCISYALTPSILSPIKKNKIPIIMTIRDPYLMCPSIKLSLKSEYYCKKELCIKGNPIHCIINRCFDKKIHKSTLAALEFLFRRYLKLFDQVDKFICTSNATMQLAVRSGIKEERLVIINNFLNQEYFHTIPTYNIGSYFLFVGRISKEKGIQYIIEAISESNENIPVKIVGEGPYKSYLIELCKKFKVDSVEFIGHKSSEELNDLYSNCVATILPCNWFETFGRTLIESSIYGKPSIASNIGGIPEIVENHKTGLLVEPGNIKELTEAILYLHKFPTKSIELGKNARAKVENLYNEEIYYTKLMQVYTESLKEPKQ